MQLQSFPEYNAKYSQRSSLVRSASSSDASPNLAHVVLAAEVGQQNIAQAEQFHLSEKIGTLASAASRPVAALPPNAGETLVVVVVVVGGGSIANSLPWWLGNIQRKQKEAARGTLDVEVACDRTLRPQVHAALGDEPVAACNNNLDPVAACNNIELEAAMSEYLDLAGRLMPDKIHVEKDRVVASNAMAMGSGTILEDCPRRKD